MEHQANRPSAPYTSEGLKAYPISGLYLKAQKVGIIGVYIVFAHPLLSLVDMNGASR